ADDRDVGDHAPTLSAGPAPRLLLDCGTRILALGQTPHEHEATWDVGRAVGVAPLEIARPLADELAEPAAERPEAREPDREAHFGDREVRRAQQVLRAFDAALRHVLHRRDAVGRAEQSEEVVLRQARDLRELVEAEWFRVVP